MGWEQMILLEKEITKLTYDEVITYVEKMVHKQEEVFVSFVEKIENVNALSFLQRNEPFFKNHHFFWKDADKDLYLSGLGYVKKFQIKETEDRFLFVKDVWQNLLPSVLIINPYQTEKAVGPVLFGGFSFLPIKKDIKRWDKFQNGLFYIPKYMLTKMKMVAI